MGVNVGIKWLLRNFADAKSAMLKVWEIFPTAQYPGTSAAQRPRHRTITTQSEQGAPVAPNLLQRDFSADQPNRKWVADTTYIWTRDRLVIPCGCA
jgi:transposase InsO family protein